VGDGRATTKGDGVTTWAFYGKEREGDYSNAEEKKIVDPAQTSDLAVKIGSQKKKKKGKGKSRVRTKATLQSRGG